MDSFKYCGFAIIFATALLACFTPQSGNAASLLDGVSVKPEVVESDEAEFAYGFEFDLNKNNQSLITNDTLTLGYSLKGEWASEDDVNTEPISAKLDLSFDWLNVLENGDLFVHGWFNGGYETDDRFDEQELSAGATLAAIYQVPLTFELDVLSHYDWVFSIESKHRDDLGGDDIDGFGRFGIETLAVLRLRKLIDVPVIKNLKLSGNYRYFYQHNLDDAVDSSREDNFDYYKIDLAYEWWPNGVFGLVQEVFISYSDGRLPTQTEDQSMWKAGLVIYGAMSPIAN